MPVVLQLIFRLRNVVGFPVYLYSLCILWNAAYMSETKPLETLRLCKCSNTTSLLQNLSGTGWIICINTVLNICDDNGSSLLLDKAMEIRYTSIMINAWKYLKMAKGFVQKSWDSWKFWTFAIIVWNASKAT